MIDHISASFIDSWVKCPYKAINERKIRNDIDTSSKFTTLGSVVHETLKKYYEADFNTSIEDIYEEEWKNSALSDLSMYQSGFTMIKNFELDEANSESKVLAREVEFTLDLDSKKDDKVPHCIVKGIIDKINYLGDGVYEIVDYKTAFHPKDRWELERDIQMAIYALAFWGLWDTGVFFDTDKYPEPKKLLLTVHYLRHGKTQLSEKTPEDIETTIKYIKTIFSQVIKYGDNPPQKINRFCPNCIFKENCEEYKKTLGVVPDMFSLEEASDDELIEYFLKLRDQNNIIEKRMDEVREILNDRILAADGEIITDKYMLTTATRKYKNRSYEMVKNLLAPYGESLIEEVITIDNKKLERVIKSLGLEDELNMITVYKYGKPTPIVKEKPTGGVIK